MKQGRRTTNPTFKGKALIRNLGILVIAAALLGFFPPVRSASAATQVAPQLAEAPAPHNSTTPIGVGALAVGLAKLAARRQK